MSETKFRILFVTGCFIVGMVVMYFLYPIFHPDYKDVLPVVVPDSTSQVSIPDTVWETKIDTVWYPDPYVVYRDTGSVDTVWKTKLPKPMGFKITKPQYVSFKHFVHSDFNESKVWAFAPMPVDSFRIDNKVKWDEYYEINVLPEFQLTLKQENKNNLMKGTAMGLFAGAGMATQNVYLAFGGVAIATVILVAF